MSSTALGVSAFANWRQTIAGLGTELNPDYIAGTITLTAQHLDPGLNEGVRRDADLAYGSHERHVLDVYTPADSRSAGTARPVVVFVHGGGFVGGAKSSDGSPFFANVGAWAVRRGYVGVAINYVLAPESPWPGGAQDISRAIAWLADNIADYGGDPQQIVLIGQSAGAMHVADYVVRPELHGPTGRGLAGAALISCLYNIGRAADKPMHRAYWGEDLTAWQQMGTLDALIDCELPLFLAVAEFDDVAFHDHAAELVTTWYQRRGEYAPMHYLYGHNHLSTVYGLGGQVDTLGPLLEQYISAVLTGPGVE